MYLLVYRMNNIKNTICFTFMGPCIVNVFKQNQQDAPLRNGIYYCQCSTSAFLKLWSADHK